MTENELLKWVDMDLQEDIAAIFAAILSLPEPQEKSRVAHEAERTCRNVPQIHETATLYDHKRCVTCDAYGYKTADDWKYGRKYCFVHKVYIGKADKMVCRDWKPTD